MKAMMLVDKKKLEMMEMPDPSPGSRDLLVRVKAVGICGSDVHGYDGSTGRRIPPIVMGHEAAGEIIAIGPEVTGFHIGQRITFDSTVYCGKCHFCRIGRVNLCEQRQVLGVSCGDYRRHGCFAEMVAIPQHIAYVLPDGLSYENAAMIEAVSVAVHAVGRTSVESEDCVVVGAGMIGQLLVQALRASGCGKLIAVDLDESRLAKARQFGAGHVLSAGRSDLVHAIHHLTDGHGATVVFDAVGSQVSMNTAIASARKGAEIVLIGNIAPKVEVGLQAIVTRELSLIGTCASSGEYPQCLEWMVAGKIDVKPLISAVAPLEEGPKIFERLYNREPGLMKVILKP